MEIINISTGRRLGHVRDAELELPGGDRLRALIVPGPARFFGLFGREPDYLLPLDCVRKLGRDVVLVEIPGEYKREPKPPRR